MSEEELINLYAVLVIKYLEGEFMNSKYYNENIVNNAEFNEYADYVLESISFRELNKLFLKLKELYMDKHLDEKYLINAHNMEESRKCFLDKFRILKANRKTTFSIIQSMSRVIETRPIDKSIFPNFVRITIGIPASTKSR